MRFFTLAFFIIGLMAVLAPRFAQAASIQVTPTGGNGIAGQPFSMDISAKGGAAVGAMQFDLAWDAAVLEFKSLDKAKVLAGSALVESKLKAPGRLSVAWVAQDSVDAEGPLLTVQFVAKGQPGQKSTLALENVRAWGPDKGHHGTEAEQHLIDVQIQTSASEFAIEAASESKWYLWGAAGLALIILFTIVLKLRGKSRPALRRG